MKNMSYILLLIVIGAPYSLFSVTQVAPAAAAPAAPKNVTPAPATPVAAAPKASDAGPVWAITF